MSVHLPEGHTVYFTSEQCRLLRIVTKHPQDYCSWRALVDSIADEVTEANRDLKIVKKIFVVFSLFLNEFPANYTDLVDYVNLLKPFVGEDEPLKKYYQDASIVLYSLQRWEQCCQVGAKLETASRYFKEAIQHVGSYYQSDKLWKLYIEHETRNKNWTAVAEIYTTLFSSPIRGIETFFTEFKVFVNERTLMEILSADEFSQFREKSTYIASREKLFRNSEKYLLEIKAFEDLLVSDSEAEALNEEIVSNWFSYLKFLIEKGDSTKVIALYNRASCQLHSYPDFWISYVEYLLSEGYKKEAAVQLDWATQNTLKRDVKLLLYSAKFKIANNDLNGARVTYVLIHSILSPNHPEAIEGHALLELRKNSYGTVIFKNAIDSERTKGNSERLSDLIIRYGRFALSAGVSVNFDSLLGELCGQSSLSLSVIQSAISLYAFHGFTTPDHISKIDEMVHTFINDRPLTNQEEKKALSSFYLEFLHRHGSPDFLDKAASRHEHIISCGGGYCKTCSPKKRRTIDQNDSTVDDDITVLNLDQFLKTVILVKDSDFQSGINTSERITKVLPIGTNLLVALVKAKLRRHRYLCSWEGQLDSKEIFITYDGSESSVILCSIRKNAMFGLTNHNFTLDWTALKVSLTPAFTSRQTGRLPIYFEDFFDRLIERVPANFLSHIESRELYFFQISCTLFLSRPSARLKLACDLYKCLRDAFFKNQVQFDSVFDTADMSKCSGIVYNPLLQSLLYHGKEKMNGVPNQKFTPSTLVSLDRHLDAHGTEAAKSIGVLIKSSEEPVDIFDYTSGTAFCDLVWDLCRNLHRDELLEDACVTFSSNVVEPPRKNPILLSRQLGITESGCLMPSEPCQQRTQRVSCVLWFGNVPYWADEVKLFHELTKHGKVKTLKLRRNSITGLPEGDGLVEFETHKQADIVQRNLSGQFMFHKDNVWVLQWATFSCSKSCFEAKVGHCILVKNLMMEVNDYILQDKFRHYKSFAGAVVNRDLNSGLSLGYGLVKFADYADYIRALSDENNKDCLGKPMSLTNHVPKAIPAIHPIPSDSAAHMQDPPTPNKRPDLNHWVGLYGHAQAQVTSDGFAGTCLKKVDGVIGHVTGMEEDDVAYELTSVQEMNQSYAIGPGRAVLGWEMKL